MTCSGGDSAVAADLASELSVDLATFATETEERLRAVLPSAARAINPLDYTSLLWDEPAALRTLVGELAADPGVDGVLVLFDDAYAAADSVGGDGAASWAAVLGAVRDGAREAPVPVGVASTLPELLVDEVAAELLADGMPALAGLPAGLRAMAALGAEPPKPERLAEIATAARRAQPADAGRTATAPGTWLSEHDAKVQLRAAGVPVPPGRLAVSADDAVRIREEFGGPLALKLSHPGVRHKSDLGAVELNLYSESSIRRAYSRLACKKGDGPRSCMPANDAFSAATSCKNGDGPLSCTPAHDGFARAVSADADVLVERMIGPGLEVLVAARRDGVVPTLVLSLGGVFAELGRIAAVVALPATPGRVERALRTLLGGAGGSRRAAAVDLGAVARIGSRVGRLLVDSGYELIELNPVIATDEGAWAVDAVACRAVAPAFSPAPQTSGIPALEDSP
jgi:acetyl-CoA synthetase